MRDAGCGMRDALHLVIGQFFPNATVVTLYSLDKTVEFPAKHVEMLMQVLVEILLGQRTGFKQCFQMVDCLVTRCVGIAQEPNEVRLVTSSPIAFHDICFHRLHRSADLRTRFELLKLGELFKRHPMHLNGEFPGQLPNL